MDVLIESCDAPQAQHGEDGSDAHRNWSRAQDTSLWKSLVESYRLWCLVSLHVLATILVSVLACTQVPHNSSHPLWETMQPYYFY